MANYAEWATPSQTSGNGSGSVNWVVAEHTGRNSRTTQPQWSATGVTGTIVQTINQAGASEFVNVANTMTIPQGGGSITISGRSNSKGLRFTISGGATLEITAPSLYTAAGVSTDNGSLIDGDPGGSSAYDFSVVISGVGANPDDEEKVAQLVVASIENGNINSTCTITQTAAAPSLVISPTTLDFPAAGGTQTVTVTSNTEWEIL